MPGRTGGQMNFQPGNQTLEALKGYLLLVFQDSVNGTTLKCNPVGGRNKSLRQLPVVCVPAQSGVGCPEPPFIAAKDSTQLVISCPWKPFKAAIALLDHYTALLGPGVFWVILHFSFVI